MDTQFVPSPPGSITDNHLFVVIAVVVVVVAAVVVVVVAVAVAAAAVVIAAAAAAVVVVLLLFSCLHNQPFVLWREEKVGTLFNFSHFISFD